MSEHEHRPEHKCSRVDPMMRCDTKDPAQCCQGTANIKCPCECHRPSNPKLCSECGWELKEWPEGGHEDSHADDCPVFTGHSRSWTATCYHASADPAWAADEIERLRSALADAESDRKRWHQAFMALKYGPHAPGDAEALASVETSGA